MKCVKCTNLRNIWGQWRSAWSSRLTFVWPEFRQSCQWKCSVSKPKWCKAHVAVTEKFTITNILNVVAQLQLEFCKCIPHLFKYPTKNHHDSLQNHIKFISRWSLSNHKSSKIFLNIRSVVVTTRGMQIGLVIPGATSWFYAPTKFLYWGMWKLQAFEISKNWFWQINYFGKIGLKWIQRIVFNVLGF